MLSFPNPKNLKDQTENIEQKLSIPIYQFKQQTHHKYKKNLQNPRFFNAKLTNPVCLKTTDVAINKTEAMSELWGKGGRGKSSCKK